MTIDDLRSQNPYVNQPYAKSGYQNLLSAIGMRTEADAWKENMAVQASEYDAALAQKQFDLEYNERYNSPVAQVSRLRQAGINPDLQSGAVDAGNLEAPSMPQDPSTPMQSTGEEQVISSVANGLMSAFTSALGMVTTFQGIHRNFLNNKLLGVQIDNEELGLGSTLDQLAQSTWKHFIPTSAEAELWDDGTAVSWQGLALDRALAFANGHVPKRFRQDFVRNVQQYWSSAPGTKEAYQAWRSAISERKGYEIDKRTNFSFIDEDLAIIADELSSFASRNEKQRYQTEYAEGRSAEVGAELESAIAEGVEPSLQASAKNAQAGSLIESADFQKSIYQSINNIVDQLKKKDDPFSKLLLIMISSMQIGLLPKLF